MKIFLWRQDFIVASCDINSSESAAFCGGEKTCFELQNTIQTLLRNKKLQNEIKVKQEERNEQSALGGADGEDREPNTYGLP